MPSTIGLVAGTPKVWASSGGDYAFTPTSLANDAGWQGAKGDLGVNWAREQNVHVEVKMASAPAVGKQLEYYWCASTNLTAGSDNPGNLAGADGSVTAPDEIKYQLLFLGPLNLSNAIGTGAQKTRFSLFPPTRYGFPVLVNKSAVALSSTAADSRVVVTPCYDEIQD